jgi:dienelactone hydrolase
MRSVLRALPILVLPALGVPAAAAAQVARMEVHPFASTTLTDQEFLTGRRDGRPVTLAGELRLPRPGSDRLPAVVLLHGSGGISGAVTDWEQELNSMGVATFVVDSFTGRGIVSTVNDQEQLGRLAMIVDAYRALDLLARHPRIDPARIALMGFSRGGRAALYAAVRRFQRLHGSAGREFAAYIPFYPDCTTEFLTDTDISERPVRIFHGSRDDYAPVTPCKAYVERLRAQSKDVQLTEYADAGHIFDGQALRKPVTLEKAPTTRGCRLVEAQDGVIVNAATKQPFTYADPCVEYGPTIAYNEVAAAAARKAVREFVISTLKP